MASKSVDLEELRTKSKYLFNKYLFEIFNSNNYQKVWNKTICGQNEFSICQIEQKYKPPIVNILAYCFSLTSGSILDSVFAINVAQSYLIWNAVIDHVIKTGLGYLIVDKNDNVILISWACDYYDKYPGANDVSSNHHNVRHYGELAAKIRKSSPIFPPNIKSNMKYGQLAYKCGIAVRPDYWGKINTFKITLLLPILVSMGYKYTEGTQVNPKTIHEATKRHKTTNWTKMVKYNLYEHHLKFEDGTLMNDYIDKQSKYDKNDIVYSQTVSDWIQFKQQTGNNLNGSELGLAVYQRYYIKQKISKL